MKRRTIGTRADHISYLNENKKMDRSIMAFNLQNQFGLKKREAADTIREWYYTEEKNKKTDNSIEESDDDDSDSKEDKFKANQFKKKGVKKEASVYPISTRDAQIFADNINDLMDQGYSPDEALKDMSGRFHFHPQELRQAYLNATGNDIEEYANIKRNSGMNRGTTVGSAPGISSGRGF